MINIIKAEIYKLKTSKIFYIITSLMIILSLMISFWFRSYNGKSIMLVVFDIQLMFPLIIMIGVLGAYYFTSEYKSGGYKKYIYFGHKRSQIILSKSIVYTSVILIIALIIPLLTVIINSFMNGFSENFDYSSILFIVRISLLNILVYIGIAVFSIFISLLLKNTIATIGVFYGIYNVYVVLQAFSMKNSSFKAIYEKTIFGQVQIASSQSITSFQIVQLIIVSVITILIALYGSVYIFKRMEIK